MVRNLEIERGIKDSKNVSSPLLTPTPVPKETQCKVGRRVLGCLNDRQCYQAMPSSCHEVCGGEGGELVEPAERSSHISRAGLPHMLP